MSVTGHGELSGCAAIVTGASRNIGRAIAVALGSGGASVLVHANSARAEAETTAGLVREAGGKAAVAMGDLTDPAVPARLVDEALAAFGRLDFVVANAVSRPEAPLAEMTYEDWRRVMALSLDSVFLLVKAALESLRRSDRAAIVTLGGLSGHAGGHHRAHVITAKAGLAGLTKALATEFGEDGITVNCVAPGLIETQRIDVVPHTKRRNALGRKGRPEDIAAMVRMLCGPDGRYITGQTLHVNGGALMV
jgi:3-oxoacyl-[acyl-carrier protein] reductase